MKTKVLLGITTASACIPLFFSTLHSSGHSSNSIPETEEAPCVFMTLMGEQVAEGYGVVKEIKKFRQSIRKGEAWLVRAQNKDGGWGAGFHANQREMDPHAVASDPATTAMAAMALYRCGYSLHSGPYTKQLWQSVDFLLNEIEKNHASPYITSVRGTQIQRKLGEHIDTALTLEFFNQIVSEIRDKPLQQKIYEGIQVCVDKLEQSMDTGGRINNAGWAGVLQSSFANAGLEKASKLNGIQVNEQKLQQARDYQKSNYNPDNEQADTREGAGIMLYAVSSSVRGSAEEAKDARQLVEQAKKEGILDQEAELTEETLVKIGVTPEKAKSYEVADKVYKSAKVKAMSEDVLKGYGNNGGEEFLSFLQTGESMIVNKDTEWKQWYDNIGGRIMSIQNNDGSWNGHHCITSPVFCTATCLLILSIENDIERLQK